MRNQSTLKIGDRLERKITIRYGDAIKDGWELGTIIDLTDTAVSIEYDNGIREVVERNKGLLRVP